jgi:transcriptional regulator of met regulon
MATEEEIKQTFLEYAKQNELSAYDTPHYFAGQFLPNESFFMKQKVIEDLIKAEIMRMTGVKWIIKE